MQQSSDWEALFLKSIVSNIPNMVFVKDAAELRFVLFNRAGEELLGMGADDLIGRNDFDFFPPEEAEFFVAKDREVLESKQLLDIPAEPIQTANGQRILHTKKIPLLDENGEPKFLLGISDDITDRVAAEAELRAAYADADAANRAKSEFLSRVSHELRTPINAILGFSQLVEMNATGEQRVQIGHVLRAGRHLLELVDDVLDIASVESGKFSVSLENVSLEQVVNEALKMVSPLAGETGVRFPQSIESDVRVHADTSRLRQIITNLLTNAVRYNKPGGEVRVEIETKGNLATLKVVDTGVGIDAEALDQIFQPFERLDAPRTGISGTGLGLAVSRNLAEAMGSSITVESEKGAGSCFSLELRVADGVNRVLYIEDNISNAQLMRSLFALHPGVELLVAEDGETGLQMVRDYRPHLVLLDLHLPGIDGDEVLTALKSDSTLSNIPIVIVSADATPSRITQLLQRGAIKYLTKPFDIDDVRELVDSLTPANSA